MSKLKILLKNLGPGLLFASMAIGTSHLVLSTKAGAQYGWIMIIPIILANVLKYPFFEFGVRYTNVTNRTLIEGYLNRGKGYLWFYAFITLISTFTILATLYVVTSGLFINLFKINDASVSMVALGLFAFISALLIIGKYKFLETSLKLVVSILFIALIVTTALVIFKGNVATADNFVPLPIFNEVGILFLIGLVGWMPTAVEASSWISLWTIEKFKITNTKLSLPEALQEFNVGYLLTGLLAIFFMVIGWMTLYGTNTVISGNAVAFSDQLIQMFTTHIGEWTYAFIATAAFATMFSTCMTAHDALARVSLDIIGLLSPKTKTNKLQFSVAIILLAIVNFLVITVFSGNMGQLVALATFVSFVLAPIIGYMNLKNVMSTDLPASAQPGKGLRIMTYLGILFLSFFAIYYCWMIFF
ncbi:NRAMP family protein [Sediminicola sp. YIK13]|uniref:NRAMP family divalent metal transporter n=1 Tax=Sediminicola sp. YIK13 TaxID=1453352 RepID=UPI00071FA171|nr:divalent metal cation transporter [Sediminicola sp. YIK13]ALM08941.1 NRAMP family protein [Sediminicola sp. YIK13]